MALTDPVAVHNSATNVEAHMVCNMLNDAGIEAHVTEDISQVGVWALGLIPEIHKPQVWIDRKNIERAGPILADSERRLAERRRAETDEEEWGKANVDARCESCGQLSSFPASQRGSIEYCPACGAYMDVIGANESADEDYGEEESEAVEE